MEPSTIARWRMRSLGLWGKQAADAAPDIVRRLGAVQAQEFPYAKWSLGQRSGASDDDVGAHFARGDFLRTHVLRPTWHFVSPRDIRWMLALTGPRVKQMMASSDRKLGLDDALSSRANGVIAKALEGGTHLTRKELVERLTREGLTGDGQRFGHLLLRAELEGLICSGIPSGKQQTYALLEERVAPGIVLDRDQALAELARRYFEARGPATLKDFSWWASLKMTDCRRAVEMLGEALEQRTVDDRTYHFEAGTEPPRRRSRADVVQVYDEVVVSYTLSRDVLRAPVGSVPRDIMFFWHPVLVDARLFGHWRHKRSNPERLELFTYTKPSREERSQIERAVNRYKGFIGRDLPVESRTNPRGTDRRPSDPAWLS